MKSLIDRLENDRYLAAADYRILLGCQDAGMLAYLFGRARAARRREFGNKIYIRGLIEISSFCKNNCYYCGIRAGNSKAERYRLTAEEIIDCCRRGYQLGFRTFVLQGGEDPALQQADVCYTVGAIRKYYPDCAIALSLGEKTYEEYHAYFTAGANRYLLRQETASAAHYRQLHPPDMDLGRRLQCLRDLKSIGYQVGMGFMVGSPHQTDECIARDLALIQEFKPEMAGVGPFIHHKDTPMRGFASGSLTQTLIVIAILRLLLPRLLLPATTALGSIHPTGREQGIQAGANVVMPNLSPAQSRGKYSLYDNKLYSGGESAEGIELLQKQMSAIGCEIAVDRGDWQPSV